MIRKYIVMMRFGNNETFNLDEQFVSKQDADKYVELMQKNKPDVKFYLFEQSKDYQLEEKEINELIEDEIIKEQEVVNG